MPTEHVIGPVGRIELAAGMLMKIADSADDREYTRSQSENAAEMVATIRSAIPELPESLYVNRLAADLEGPVTPDTIRVAREIAKVVSFNALRAQRDVFRDDPTITVERASGVRDVSIADLFRDASVHGFSSMDFSVAGPMTTRALQSAGGSAVETSFSDTFTRLLRTATPLLDPRNVTLLEYGDGSPRIYPRLTADPSLGGTVTAEAAGITLADPTLSQVTLNPYAYKGMTYYSSELGQDAAFGLDRIVADSLVRELSVDVNTALTLGNGSGAPNGIVTAATAYGTASGTSTTSGTYLGYLDLIDLAYSLPESYREVGKFMANATTISQIRKMRDAQGNLIWQPSLAAGQPATVLGYPIIENAAMASGSAATSVIFGDLSRYFVQSVTVRVEVSKSYRFGNDEWATRAILRVDGDLVDVAGVRSLVNVAI